MTDDRFPDALEAAIEAAFAERLFCSNCGGPANDTSCEYCDRGLILRAAIRAYGEQCRAEERKACIDIQKIAAAIRERGKP